MARYVILFLSMLLLGCEINGKQIIKPEKFTYDQIKFNTVSKKLIFENLDDGLDIENMKSILRYWFDNKIKTDGFDGNLNLNIKNITTQKIRKDNYFKFLIKVSLQFEETHNDLNRTKTFIISVSEYGEISGSFSIKDQENIELNVMHKSLDSVSKKLLELN
jgi:hypothetical protein